MAILYDEIENQTKINSSNFAGVLDYIEKNVKNNTIKCAINSSGGEHIFTMLGDKTNLFTDILDGRKITSKKEKILKQIETWNVDIKDILFVTDSVNDLQSCLAAGLKAQQIIPVSWGFLNAETLIKGGFLEENIIYNIGELVRISGFNL